MAVTDHLASGLRSLPGATRSFASTQAAWRFYANDRVSLVQLAQPLLEEARTAIQESCQDYALVIHDWSRLDYNSHHDKQDRIALGQKNDRGYKLQCALVINDRDGEPLAPVYQGLQARDGVYSSRSDCVETPQSPLDGLSPVMAHVQELRWEKPAVHIVDAEADSVAHFRYWQRMGHRFVVRVDNNNLLYQGEKSKPEEVRQHLRREGHLRLARPVEYHGRLAEQWVGEATITLTRPGTLKREGKAGPKIHVPGPPLTLRLVIAEVRDESGEVLAVWFLMTNLPESVSGETVALWYYWRWRVESYFKVLKSAGYHLEQWQQETASAVARRLLVAAMALVVVWKIARSPAPAAEPVREFLARLSGRQMKHGQASTYPALLAGLWTYLAMVETLKHYDLGEMQKMIASILPSPPNRTDSG